jgi:ribosomal protein S19E (S16A)
MKSDPLYRQGTSTRIALQFAAAMNKPITTEQLLKVFPHKFGKNATVSKQNATVNKAVQRLIDNGHINSTQQGWVITDAGKEHLRTYAPPYKGEKD